MIEVADPQDPRLHEYMDLTDVALRRVREPALGLFMAESLVVLERALAAGYRPRSVLTGERWLAATTELLDERLGALAGSVPVFVGTESVVSSTTGFRMHRGPMAAMARLPLPPVADVVQGAQLVVVLAGWVDHTNVGAVFRSAAALGADAILVTADCADPLYRRSVRVSMGSVFSLPWTVTDDWVSDLRGFTTVALTPAADAQELPVVAGAVTGPVAVLIGSEGPGLSVEAQSAAAIRCRIPMANGVDSLNAAASAAVAIYALASGAPAR